MFQKYDAMTLEHTHYLAIFTFLIYLDFVFRDYEWIYLDQHSDVKVWHLGLQSACQTLEKMTRPYHFKKLHAKFPRYLAQDVFTRRLVKLILKWDDFATEDNFCFCQR